jgi:hypothetical protein
MPLGLPLLDIWSKPRYSGAPGQMATEELVGQVRPAGIVIELVTAVQVPVHRGVLTSVPTKFEDDS